MKNILVYGDGDVLKNYSIAFGCCGVVCHFQKSDKIDREYDGMLLAGGGDMHPCFYGQNLSCCNHIDMARDIFELNLIDYFTFNKLPIFGICRGIQVINAALGGTLIQDIDSGTAHSYDEETGDRIHEIRALKDGFLYPIYGERFPVNSAHHQAIDRLGDNLEIAAVCGDGVIEAVFSQRYKIYGLQFHPERMAFSNMRGDTADGSGIFRFFAEVLEQNQ